MKFTIEEIRNYIKSQDSLGDVLYFLSEENIKKANQPSEDDMDDIDSWDRVMGQDND